MNGKYNTVTDEMHWWNALRDGGERARILFVCVYKGMCVSI